MASQPLSTLEPARGDKSKGLVGSILHKAAIAAHTKLSAHLGKPMQSPSEYQWPGPYHNHAPSYIPEQQAATHPPDYTAHGHMPYQIPHYSQSQPPSTVYNSQQCPPSIEPGHSGTAFIPFGNGIQQPQDEKTVDMTTGIICPGCEVGLIPGDVCFCCQICSDKRNTFCESCHYHGRACAHNTHRSRLSVRRDLKKEQDPKDELGLHWKCIGCKTKIKDLDVCWHCNECFSYPNTCQDCWKAKGKRCRHAGRKKIELRKVRSRGESGSGIEDALDVLESVFG